MVDTSNYQNFLTNINNNITLFSKAERKLALFFLKNDNAEPLFRLTAGAIAHKAGVSKATVSRFIRKIGYAGFTEFHYLLRENARIRGHKTEATAHVLDDMNFIYRIKDEYNFLMERTINNINQCSLISFIDHLTSARNIYIAGLGPSSFSAKEMTRKFIQLGMCFRMLDEISLILSNTLIMQQADFFIIFSLQGESKYLLQAIKLASSKRVYIVLITNKPHSALANYADCVFLTTYETSMMNETFIFPRLSQLFLIDVLFNAVVASDPKKYTEIMQAMSRSQPKYNEEYIVARAK